MKRSIRVLEGVFLFVQLFPAAHVVDFKHIRIFLHADVGLVVHWVALED